MEIKRLGAEHYDDLINLLNVVFSRKNGRDMDFEKEIPKMCVRDDEHMGKHLGIYEGDRLAAAMGVYPFDTVVAGQELTFATTGNIAVHWDFEGRGYMGAMLDFAMKELERMNVDCARLGGLRSRYNRYGFETCGQNYSFNFTSKNRERKFVDFKDDITFAPIGADDVDWHTFAASIYNRKAIAVPRTPENVYLCMTTWKNRPFIAMRGGYAIGYLCVNPVGDTIAEMAAVDVASLADMVCAWQARVGEILHFTLPAYDIEAIRLFSAVCESSSIVTPSHFKVRNWEKVVDAFLKLKASYSPLVCGELIIEVVDYGTIRLFVDGENVGCERTERSPDVSLDGHSASRYIFGPYPPICTADAPAIAQAWFPLPLSWNGQDRV